MMNIFKTASGQLDADAVARPDAGDDTKLARILAILRSGRSLNRFEAEAYGDHCLNSSVSALRADGNLIHGEWERVPTRFGKKARVLRYSYVGRE